MAEETLVINASINIDETPGNNATSEVDPTTLSTLMSASLFGYINTNFLSGGASLGTPDNATHESAAISTPDGFDNLLWTDMNGDPLSAEATSLMALDPVSGNYEAVTISTDTNDNVLVGTTATSGNFAFIAVIDSTSQTSSDIYLLTFMPMRQTNTGDPDDIVGAILTEAWITVAASQSFDDFSDAPSGANDWLAFGDSAGGIQLLATSDPYEIGAAQSGNSTVNTSTIGLGTNKQSVEVGDLLRIDLVDGATTGAALTSSLTHDADAISFDNFITGTNEIQFGLVQTGGNAANRVDLKSRPFSSTQRRREGLATRRSSPPLSMTSMRTAPGQTRPPPTFNGSR